MSSLPAETIDWTDAFRVRPRGLATWDLVFRAAVASTVAYVVSVEVTGSALPIFAPVTTLLVVQASPFAAIGASVQRIGGTALGVALASLWVNAVGTTWWSFLIAVLISAAVAKVLPISLAAQLQIPIAVVFVMALGPDTLASDLGRVVDVAIGGAIGLAAVYLWPPRVTVEPTRRAVADAREAIAAQLRTVGAEVGSLVEPLPPEEQHDFVAGSRALGVQVAAAREALALTVESARFNPRALRVGDRVDGLARAVRRVAGLAVQVRAISAAADRLYDRPGEPAALPAAEFRAVAEALADTVDAVRLDGDLLRFVAEPADLARLGERIREAADAVTTERERVADVLESISLLGRLDHLRVTLAAGPDHADEYPEPGPTATRRAAPQDPVV